MTNKPIQDFYPHESAVCYGCGRNNEHGHHVKTYWDGEFGIARFTPKEYHHGYPGFVYGGLLASLIDCHTMGTSIGAKYDAMGIAPSKEEVITAVTGNLNVSYIKPTPMGVELVFKARVKELHERKAIITCSVYANDIETVKSEVIAVYVESRLTMGERQAKKDQSA